MPNLTRLGIVSGNVVPLSLNEAIRLALTNNNDIEVSRDDVRYAETQLRALQGVYDPVFAITPTIDKRISPQQSSLGGAGRSSTTTSTTYTLSPSVNKSFERGGGTYTMSFANQHTNTSSSFSLINPFYSSNLSLQFTQPLMRNRSYDINRHQIRVQRKRLEQSDADFRRKTIDVIAQVQSAYWDLVFAMRDQQVQLDNVNLSRENLRQIEAQISAGAKAPLDRSEVLTELANRESALLSATQTVSVAENTLKQLILKDPTVPQWSAQITPTDTPVVDTNPVNLNDAITEARKNRPELQRLRLQQDINTLDIKYFKNQTLPQVDVQSTFATTGLAGKALTAAAPAGTLVPLIGGDPNTNASAFLLSQIQDIQRRGGFLPVATSPLVPATGGAATDLVGGYGRDLANLFGFKTRNITVGVAIQIPFKNKTAEANLAGARIQKEQVEASMRSTEQLVEVDVRNAAQNVESSRLQVLTAREARRNAEIQLEGEQRLYSVGRSTTYLLIQRQNALANARDAEVRAETGYSKAVSNLQHATSTTLHANNVIVDNPLKP
jgi:HAE1 family hydrophobic/amphiphilic exporter-1